MAHASPQFEAEASQLDSDVRGYMLPVELVNQVAAHQLCPDNPLPDEARKAAPDAYLRPTWHLSGNFSDSQGFPALRQDSQYRPVEGRGYRARRVREIHDLKV